MWERDSQVVSPLRSTQNSKVVHNPVVVFAVTPTISPSVGPNVLDTSFFLHYKIIGFKTGLSVSTAGL